MFENFQWLNEPKEFSIEKDRIKITTKNETDFWQRTHYGFRRDDGHFFYKKITGDFIIQANFKYFPNTQYDQCGLLIRLNEDNWIKTSVEFENEVFSHLGSVVTNFGYSDWSTQEIPAKINEVIFEIKRNSNDFIINFSFDNKKFQQVRIAHLHLAQDELMVGIYSCSPKREGFECEISNLKIN